jgi:hypothetical protein
MGMLSTYNSWRVKNYDFIRFKEKVSVGIIINKYFSSGRSDEGIILGGSTFRKSFTIAKYSLPCTVAPHSLSLSSSCSLSLTSSAELFQPTLCFKS